MKKVESTLDLKYKKHDVLLKNIKLNLPELKKILKLVNSERGTEDLTYRYYHGSFKVFGAQDLTKRMVDALNKLSPTKGQELDGLFMEIYQNGCPMISWDIEHNDKWSKTCRPFLEAFFHARYFVEMAVKYGKKYKKAPQILDFGWAALLTLYGIR